MRGRRRKRLPAGHLRDRLEVFNPTETPDGQGGSTLTYPSVADFVLRGSVRALSVEEVIQARQLRQMTTHTVRIRKTSKVTRRSRLVFNGQTLEVGGVRDIGFYRDDVELPCQELK